MHDGPCVKEVGCAHVVIGEPVPEVPKTPWWAALIATALVLWAVLVVVAIMVLIARWAWGVIF